MVVVLVFYNEVGYLPALSVAAAGQLNSNPEEINANVRKRGPLGLR